MNIVFLQRNQPVHIFSQMEVSCCRVSTNLSSGPDTGGSVRLYTDSEHGHWGWADD